MMISFPIRRRRTGSDHRDRHRPYDHLAGPAPGRDGRGVRHGRPVFFIFLLGFIELGRGFMIQHLMTNAARQGCRVAVIEGKTTTDVNNAVYAVLNGRGHQRRHGHRAGQ